MVWILFPTETELDNKLALKRKLFWARIVNGYVNLHTGYLKVNLSKWFKVFESCPSRIIVIWSSIFPNSWVL